MYVPSLFQDIQRCTASKCAKIPLSPSTLIFTLKCLWIQNPITNHDHTNGYYQPYRQSGDLCSFLCQYFHIYSTVSTFYGFHCLLNNVTESNKHPKQSVSFLSIHFDFFTIIHSCVIAMTRIKNNKDWRIMNETSSPVSDLKTSNIPLPLCGISIRKPQLNFWNQR